MELVIGYFLIGIIYAWIVTILTPDCRGGVGGFLIPVLLWPLELAVFLIWLINR